MVSGLHGMKMVRKSEGNYKDDKLASSTKYTYFENGQIKEEGNYKDGKKDGKWTEWHKNGQKSEERNYKDGKADGKWTYWHENGQIK